jgi:hypothetical protein
MTNFNVPTKEEEVWKQSSYFDKPEKGVGFVSNIYAAMGHS